jgi:outer membrane protein TolC
VTASLAGCVVYTPAPLPVTSSLQTSLAGLDRALPGGGAVAMDGRLSLRDVASLAVLNDPDLQAARAQHGVAAAELLAAGLPPDPSITGGFAALLGGPGAMPAITAGLTQDVSAIITYAPDRAAAKAGLQQVDAGILWQEWQVAAQAEQFCISLAGERETMASLSDEQSLLNGINAGVDQQMAAGNLTLTDSTASATALAGNAAALNAAAQAYAHDRDQLDALLNLAPGTEINVAPADMPGIDPDVVQQAMASLAQRRPDLLALRYGYTQADEKLRAAILTQFLPISLGAGGGRDTSGVISAGPQVTLSLPLFSRNRAGIAQAQATRAALRAQYAVSLDGAVSAVDSLLASSAQLRVEVEAADAAAAQARQTAVAAQKAYAGGELDARAAADLLIAAGDREREAIALHVQLQTAELSLATMLGLGLPPLPGAAQENSQNERRSGAQPMSAAQEKNP